MTASTDSRAPEGPLPEGRPVFILAHPAHELRLFGWLARTKPVVQVLTRGTRSGSAGDRLRATTHLVIGAGGSVGHALEPMIDRELYALVMASDAHPFHRIVDAFRDLIISADAGWVVTDAWQLYNVGHDLTHLAARIAAAEAGRRFGRPVPVFDYDVVPPAMGLPHTTRRSVHALALDRDTLAAKLAAARAFPDIGAELVEVVAPEGQASLSIETLRQPLPLAQLRPPPGQKPPFEIFGEQRTAAGLYQSVLRWAHAEPIVASLIARSAGEVIR